MKATLSMSGFSDYLEDLAAAGGDVDAVVAQALNESAPLIDDEMHRLLRESSETWTGETEATLFKTEAQLDGNFIFVEIGADTSKDPAGIYKELGTARQAAEPFIRPPFTSQRHRWRNKVQEVLKRLGVL